MTSNWQEMFDKRNGGGGVGESIADAGDCDTDMAPPPDPNDYKPWLLQRGSGRPAMFLDLRRFDPKTGVLIGCQMSYPHLIAVDYIGDRMVSLDFGMRQFVIEGVGLTALAMRLQQSMVLAIQEYSPRIWPLPSTEPMISRIIKIPNTDIRGDREK